MAEIRYNKSIVKNINESLIRKSIRQEGPFTKTKIARITELSFPTVSRIIDDMAQSGEILRNGVDPTTGGRHAMSYVVNPDFAYFLCMYVIKNGTGLSIRTLVINSLGQMVRRLEDVHIPEGIPAMVENMDRIVEEESGNYSIRALSIGLPWGISHGLIQFGAKDTCLMNYPLQEHMETRFGIRTRVENDMNTMVIGCYQRTYKEEGGSMVCVSIGTTGLGCGLYLRGHLIRGFHGFAGELSYLPTLEGQNLQACLTDEGLNVEAITRLVVNLCCSVDPQTIVFYKRNNVEEVLPQVRELCKQYLPEEVIPQMVVSDQYEQDFENGLIQFGKELLVCGYEIVNR